MFDNKTHIVGAAFLLAAIVCIPRLLPAAEEIYAPPSVETARDLSLNWVADSNPEQPLLKKVAQLWKLEESQQLNGQELLNRVVQTFALVDPPTAEFVEACSPVSSSLVPPKTDIFHNHEGDEFYLSNLRLYYARYLTQSRMYDEALDSFSRINVERVVDPAGYFFFKAVCEHHLLMKKEGLKTVENLLKNTEEVPVRYATVARLMKHDLTALKERSLDEVSRKMSDIERRLDLGRGGPKVQKVESEVIALLDEIIKKREQQNQGGGGGGSGQGGGNQSSNPAQESTVKGRKAPGEVDSKKFKQEGGWGALPPKVETRAKNMINRNFPSHYRQAVEEYFKKLANRRAAPDK